MKEGKEKNPHLNKGYLWKEKYTKEDIERLIGKHENPRKFIDLYQQKPIVKKQ